MDLQTLQSRLFADIAQFIGGRGGYVFFTRFDNMIAVTNGIDHAAHSTLQESVGNRYPVTISLGVDVAETPADALNGATERLQDAGSAQDKTRTEVLAGQFLDPSKVGTEPVHIAHFDVNDATGKYTDQLNEFDSFIHIERSYASLMEYMRKAHGGLSFFVGGDNIIAVCPELSAEAYQDALDHVENDTGVDLKVGVGRGKTPHEAGITAKHALEDCRYDGTTVEFAQSPVAAGDD
jgi:GTP cyclohydrolase IIa